MQKLDTIYPGNGKKEKIKIVDTRYFILEMEKNGKDKRCRYQILQTGNMQILDTIDWKYVDTRYYSL